MTAIGMKIIERFLFFRARVMGNRVEKRVGLVRGGLEKGFGIDRLGIRDEWKRGGRRQTMLT